MKKLLVYLVFGIFLTSSFDIFFNLNLGGFNIRTCYLASFAYILLVINQKDDAHKFSFIGALPFLIWVLFITLFVYNSPFLSRNVGYLAWLAFNLLVCYVIYSISGKISMNRFLRLYLISFFVLSLAGIVQFLLSNVGIHVLVTSWWRINMFPRVNAFSYEPSYYATYLLIGFVMIYHLTFKQVFLFNRRFQMLMLVSIGCAILLSTSRMGILFVLVIFLYDFVKMLIRSAVTLRISKVNFGLSAAFLICFFSLVGVILNDPKLRARYLSGTGVESTASHSKDLRIRQITDVYDVFLLSPFEGYSLGGIAPAIAEMRGDPANNQQKVKEHEGLNIFLEVLAASGVVGFVFFLWWLFQLFRCNISMSKNLRQYGFENEAVVSDALRKALIAELLILILSQNILRPYLWILIGMTNALYFRFKPLVFNPWKDEKLSIELQVSSE